MKRTRRAARSWHRAATSTVGSLAAVPSAIESGDPALGFGVRCCGLLPGAHAARSVAADVRLPVAGCQHRTGGISANDRLLFVGSFGSLGVLTGLLGHNEPSEGITVGMTIGGRRLWEVVE
jgi:hypothetical protein